MQAMGSIGSRSSRRVLKLVILVISAVYLFGGTCEEPEVLKSEFHPKYVCTDETSLFTWETDNIDRIEISDRDGDLLMETGRSSGSWETPRLNDDIVPFSGRGYVDGEGRTYSLGNLLLLSDNPAWVSYETKVTDGQLTYGPPKYVYQEEQVDGSVVTVEWETVYRTVNEYIWRVPASDFSTRARVIKIENRNNEDFYIGAGGSLSETLVSAHAALDIQSPFFPGVDWHARRPNPQPVAVGRHRVGTGKEGVEIYSTPARREIALFVRCWPD
jgi:hypothetical protein